jgi:hypothetical protein
MGAEQGLDGMLGDRPGEQGQDVHGVDRRRDEQASQYAVTDGAESTSGFDSQVASPPAR